MSLSDFHKLTAAVFKVPEKFTIESCAASAANLFDVVLKGNFVILLISLTIFLSKPLRVFKPVPTAVPPCAKKKISFKAASILEIDLFSCD